MSNAQRLQRSNYSRAQRLSAELFGFALLLGGARERGAGGASTATASLSGALRHASPLASLPHRPLVSASSDSLVKTMFGEQQLSALADYIRAARMLKFNKRV